MRTEKIVNQKTGLSAALFTLGLLGWVLIGGQGQQPASVSSPANVEAAQSMPSLEDEQDLEPVATLDQDKIDRTIAAVQKYRLSSVLTHRNVLQQICRSNPSSLACAFLAERLVYEWLPLMDAYATLRRAQLVEQKDGLAFMVQDRRGKGGRVVLPQGNLFREQARIFFEHQFEYYTHREYGISPSAPEAEAWARTPFYDFRFEGGYFKVTVKEGRIVEAERFMTERAGGHFWLHKRPGKDPYVLPNKIKPRHHERIRRIIDGEMPVF